VLELKNTIVIGQGGIPGKGTWKLKDSTGFDPAPRGKDEIVVVESEPGVFVEAYVGWVSFKEPSKEAFPKLGACAARGAASRLPGTPLIEAHSIALA